MPLARRTTARHLWAEKKKQRRAGAGKGRRLRRGPPEEGEEDFEADFEGFEESGESELELSDDEVKPFTALRSGFARGKGFGGALVGFVGRKIGDSLVLVWGFVELFGLLFDLGGRLGSLLGWWSDWGRKARYFLGLVGPKFSFVLVVLCCPIDGLGEHICFSILLTLWVWFGEGSNVMACGGHKWYLKFRDESFIRLAWKCSSYIYSLIHSFGRKFNSANVSSNSWLMQRVLVIMKDWCCVDPSLE